MIKIFGEHNKMICVKPIHVEFSEADRYFIINEIEKRLTSGYLSQGEAIQVFEREFASYVRSKYALAVSSGSSAIELAMAIKNVNNQTVLVQANAHFSTIMGPLRCGAHIKLVDIDPNSLSPSLKILEDAYSPEVTGVIIVHIGGIISPEINRISDWAKKKNIWLFEDCAHAHGSSIGGIHAGNFGFCGAFSFFPTKVMTTGEGGMLVTNDVAIAEEVVLYRNLGKKTLWGNKHYRFGYNARMCELSAILGLTQLKKLKDNLIKRTNVAQEYYSRLKDYLEVIMPDHEASWYKFIVLLPNKLNRNKIKRRMFEKGVTCAGEVYELTLDKQPIFKNLFRGQYFRMAEEISKRQLCLPIHPAMKSSDINHVITTLKDATRTP
jgi:perosamine synthetase